jgi:tetratricopeptide (TPR) repeat protein
VWNAIGDLPATAQTQYRSSLWLPIILLLTNFPAEALQIAHRIAEARGADGRAWCAYAFCHYFQRDFKTAENLFLKALSSGPADWVVYTGLALVYLSLGNPSRAAGYCFSLATFARTTGPIRAGITILQMRRQHRERSAVDGQRSESLEEASSQFPHAPAMDDGDFIQTAILSIDEAPETAVLALSLALQRFQPLALLLPIWPIFDPLRDRDDFKQLIASHLKALDSD